MVRERVESLKKRKTKGGHNVTNIEVSQNDSGATDKSDDKEKHDDLIGERQTDKTPTKETQQHKRKSGKKKIKNTGNN